MPLSSLSSWANRSGQALETTIRTWSRKRKSWRCSWCSLRISFTSLTSGKSSTSMPRTSTKPLMQSCLSKKLRWTSKVSTAVEMSCHGTTSPSSVRCRSKAWPSSRMMTSTLTCVRQLSQKSPSRSLWSRHWRPSSGSRCYSMRSITIGSRGW